VTESEALVKINELKKEFHFTSIIYTLSDILEVADEENISLSREEAIKVIDLLEYTKDCNYGITWKTILIAIQSIKDLQKN